MVGLANMSGTPCEPALNTVVSATWEQLDSRLSSPKLALFCGAYGWVPSKNGNTLLIVWVHPKVETQFPPKAASFKLSVKREQGDF